MLVVLSTSPHSSLWWVLRAGQGEVLEAAEGRGREQVTVSLLRQDSAVRGGVSQQRGLSGEGVGDGQTERT